MRIGIMMRHMEGQIGGVATYTLEVLEHMFKIDSLNEFVLFYKTPPPRHQSFTRFPNVEEAGETLLPKSLVVHRYWSIQRTSIPLRKGCTR